VAHDSWRPSLLGARDCIARRIGGAALAPLTSNQALNGKVVPQPLDASRLQRLQALGVLCGFSAGAWLGAAEAPTKFVNAGVSPIVVSLLMVIGVFLARWSLPALIRGTGQIRLDVREAPHLIVWGVLAGCLWAVANTMTIFAIRDIGLSIAFPLWNINSLLGIFWGFFLFNELRDAGLRWVSVIGGAVLMFAGATLLTLASSSQMAAQHATRGILAALCAGILWGTMYIPYRKAYLTGMNPLSFVAFFTIGELGMMTVLALSYSGGPSALWSELLSARPALFWLMLGGFVWVIGDLFQQYAAKYVGISRGIPLSNSNQLWGLLWGIFVFGELQGRGSSVYVQVIGGSLLMATGAGAIALSTIGGKEHARWDEAARREGQRYGVDANYVQAGLEGTFRNHAESEQRRNWLDWVLVVGATAVFIILAALARAPELTLNGNALAALCIVMFILLAGCGVALWKITRFN
jgi:drug/metabolite transporter (DMT)-like permease